MKKTPLFACISALLLHHASTCHSTEPAGPDLAWFHEANYGLFIHWGVYAVPAGVYHGKELKGIGEWIMKRDQIPVAEYRDYARQFNPTNFNAEAWVKLAKESGMKYIVITAKHHDGFAMFDSKASDWNIVKASPFGRDPLQELAAACRKEGIKLGFYYSQAQDWNNGGSVGTVPPWDAAQKVDVDAYLDKVAVPQLKELLSNYGEFPSVLWWDTPVGMTPERAQKIARVLKQKPGVLCNDRLSDDIPGDFETVEQRISQEGPPSRAWELCMTINNTWGYKSKDVNFKSSIILLHALVDAVSKGGNLLLNVGPDATGTIPQPEVERLQEIGSWLRINGEAIYGCSPSPLKEQPNWGRCTQKGGKLYLSVFNWPADSRLHVAVVNTNAAAWLLTDPDKMLKCVADKNDLVVQLPTNAPPAMATIIVLDPHGKLQLATADQSQK